MNAYYDTGIILKLYTAEPEAEAHAGATGCRTLDSLHVACAALLSATEFITSDYRQIALAEV